VSGGEHWIAWVGRGGDLAMFFAGLLVALTIGAPRRNLRLPAFVQHLMAVLFFIGFAEMAFRDWSQHRWAWLTVAAAMMILWVFSLVFQALESPKSSLAKRKLSAAV